MNNRTEIGGDGLLIKVNKQENLNKTHRFHLRKLGGNYLLYKYAFVVNKENKVTGLVRDNGYLVIDKKQFDNMDSELVGLTSKQLLKKIEKSDDDDFFLLYSLEDVYFFKEPLSLSKPVRGLRYATSEEIDKLLFEVVSIWFDYDFIPSQEIIYGSERLDKIYSKCMENDLMKYYFEYLNIGGVL